MKKMIDLQLFAEVGSTNTTGTLSTEMQIHYDKTLIDKAGPKLVHEQFAERRTIPLRAGMTVDFRCVEALPKATTPIVEGITPEPGKLNVTNKRATVKQYGDYVPVTDVLEMTAADPLIVETTEKSGEQMGLTRDTVLRDILAAGTNVMFAPSVVDGVETAVNERSALTVNSKLTLKVVQRAVAKLRAMNAPTFAGDYVCILHPYVEVDFMGEKTWQEVSAYAKPENIFAGEIGRIAGCRFVVSSESKVWSDETCPADLSVYSCLFIGKGAYATTDMEGSGSQVIVKPNTAGGTANPLNLYGTIGWKTLFTGVILSEEYMVRVECCSASFPRIAAN